VPQMPVPEGVDAGKYAEQWSIMKSIIPAQLAP